MGVSTRLIGGLAVVLSVAGCLRKDNPVYGLGGSGGGTGATDPTDSTRSTTASSTTRASDSGGGMCPIEFGAAFDGSEPYQSETPWTIGGGQAVGPSCPLGLSIVRYEGFVASDGVFTTSIRVNELCSDGSDYKGGGLMARLQDTLNCSGLVTIYCLINVEDNEVRLGMSSVNCNGEDNEEYVENPEEPFELGVTYSIRLQLQGDQAQCLVAQGTNSEIQARLDDTSIIPSSGGVGFWAESAEVSFDSLSACAAP